MTAPGLRLGQQVWNTLATVAPALAEPFRGGPLDPYYDDSRLPAFLSAVDALAASRPDCNFEDLRSEVRELRAALDRATADRYRSTDPLRLKGWDNR